MSRDTVQHWDTTADNNLDLAGFNLGEGVTSANSINNIIRAMMAQLASYLKAAVALDLWAGTSAAKQVTPKSIKDASAWITVADAATITLDHAAGRNFTLSPSFGSNRTLAALANPVPGQPVFFLTKQDGTGSRTLTVNPAQWIFPGRPTTAPLSPGANAVTMISGVVGPAGEVYANAVRFG